MKRIAVTGASGFIGGHLIDDLMSRGQTVRAIVRSEQAAQNVASAAEAFTIDNVHEADAWDTAVSGWDVVIHLIGLAHSSAEDAGGNLQNFRDVNAGITEFVVDACLRGSVGRLVYLSSIKAVGEGASNPYTEESLCLPENAYGKSKREAELLILERSHGTALEASIVRPPVVYGPGAKGNIVRMMRFAHGRLPLPIRCLKAMRSMVYVGNLVDALCCIVEAKQLVQGIFHISDPGAPLTTRETFLKLGELMGRRITEIPVPASLLRVLGRAVGMREEADRLTRSLTTRGSRLTDELGWRPPYSTQEGLSATVQWFVEKQANGEET